MNVRKKIRVFEINLGTTSKQEMDNYCKRFEDRKQWKNDNLIRLLHFHENSNSMMCADVSQATIIGEYYQMTLNSEAEQNFTQSFMFNESRLWLIAYQIVSACAYLEEKGMYHGELKTQTIYLDESENIKLIEHSFLPNHPDAYSKAFILDEFHLLPPEQLEELKQSIPATQKSGVKGDVFTLGLILLELAAQQSSSAYYNWQKKVVDLEQVKKMCDMLLCLGYSSIFQKLILQMIGEYEKRPTFVVIRDGLQKLEKDILGGIQFYKNHIKQERMNEANKKQFQTFGQKM
ncbi:unnamed protein product (macronuclear) [Paramecium tetraurelia]|uniref:Protein kinase domain-containing protein n=1 Tax=Paramecium tetraurelia TaxID=5888 RepID=A0EA40_PARTE|nr:uncharacterized protein GSPATT00024889001 [Paramecium tetraurelia]CAK92157.1 unnamed protein product [Paramecium tetraurelia]|eukprot:XP_001459554.1 hypothetical protein (macronuclear) [Paramecium tetraurelia strain d4-2]